MRFSVVCVVLVFLGGVAWQARSEEEEEDIASAILEVGISITTVSYHVIPR